MGLYGNFAVGVIREFFDNTRLMKILAIVMYILGEIFLPQDKLRLSIVAQV